MPRLPRSPTRVALAVRRRASLAKALVLVGVFQNGHALGHWLNDNPVGAALNCAVGVAAIVLALAVAD